VISAELMLKMNLSLWNIRVSWRRITDDILTRKKISKEVARDDGNFDKPTNLEKL
jgi:hypothetical protein